MATSGEYLKSDGTTVNIADLLTGATATGRTDDVKKFAPHSGEMIRRDGSIVNIADALESFFSNAGNTGTTTTTETTTTTTTAETKTLEDFGAVGDGVTDDTAAIVSALNSGNPIVCLADKTYIFDSKNEITKSFYLDLNGSTIQRGSTKETSIRITSSDVDSVTIKNGTLDGVQFIDDGNNSADHVFTDLTVKNTLRHGIYSFGKKNSITVKNCTFNEIGQSTTLDHNSAGTAIATNADNVDIQFNTIKRTYASGIRVVDGETITISNNTITDVDFRGIIISTSMAWSTYSSLENFQDYLDTLRTHPYGKIENNIIQRCGLENNEYRKASDGTVTHVKTGIGCNGIYGNRADCSQITVSRNIIQDVCENGIEGDFGIVEYNYIENTGVNMEEKEEQSPSASGINMYGGIYRYNIIINPYLAGLYVYKNINSNDENVYDKKIYGNRVYESRNSDYSIYINAGTSGYFENIYVCDNIVAQPIYFNESNPMYNCVEGGNECLYGDIHTEDSLPVILIDPAEIVANGIVISTDDSGNKTIDTSKIYCKYCSKTVHSDGTVTITVTDDADSSGGRFYIKTSGANSMFAFDCILSSDQDIPQVNTMLDGSFVRANKNIPGGNDTRIGGFLRTGDSTGEAWFVVYIGSAGESVTVKRMVIKKVIDEETKRNDLIADVVAELGNTLSSDADAISEVI